MARYSTRVGFSVHDGVRMISASVVSCVEVAKATGKSIEDICAGINTELARAKVSKKTIDRIVGEVSKKAVRLGESVEYELLMEAAFANQMKESGWEYDGKTWAKSCGGITAEILWRRTWGGDLICDAEVIISGHGRMEVASRTSLRAAAEQLVAQMRAIGTAADAMISKEVQ